MKKRIIIILIICLLIIAFGSYYFINGNRNESSDFSFKIDPEKIETKELYNQTENKSIIFFGDSIVYGFLSGGYSWANYIQDNYDFSKVKNAGISDYRVSTYDSKSKWLVDEVKNYENEIYDYVILEGGVNDMIYDTPLGKVAITNNPNDFDQDTFSGGLELYIYECLKNWPEAKIGYIISYYPKYYTERGKTWSEDEYQKYVKRTIEILNKWNISYLDLSSEDFSSILKVGSKKYMPDYLHLNLAGYNIISPYIYEWIKIV